MSLREVLRRLRPHYLVAIVLALLVYAFISVAGEVAEGETLAFDKSVILLLREAGNPADPVGSPKIEEAARDVTALGSFTVLGLIVAAVTLSLLFMGQHRTAVFILAAIITGTALSTLLKSFFDRPRPDLTGVVTVFTSSFPSGHALVSAVAYLTLGACLAQTTDKRRLKAFYIGYAIFLTGIIGFSRVYLGVHYPTDVFAGWAIGTAWALACWTVMSVWQGARDNGRGRTGAGCA